MRSRPPYRGLGAAAIAAIALCVPLSAAVQGVAAPSEGATGTPQAAESSQPQPGATKTFLDIEFVWCPAGNFLQGSRQAPEAIASALGGRSEWYADERPERAVTFRTGFWMSRYEITKRHWSEAMGDEPWPKTEGLVDKDTPVTQVSWEDCRGFVEALNLSEEGVFRLPTESEWEYACRAGTSSLFNFGDAPEDLADHAWFRGNAFDSDEVRHVGRKAPNAWGLYDMLGNAWEWCEDAYAAYGAARDSSASSGYRVIRGGSINNTSAFLRCAYRLGSKADEGNARLGFRIVRER